MKTGRGSHAKQTEGKTERNELKTRQGERVMGVTNQEGNMEQKGGGGRRGGGGRQRETDEQEVTGCIKSRAKSPPKSSVRSMAQTIS